MFSTIPPENLLKKIPKEIGKEIFSFLIPDPTKIIFHTIQENETCLPSYSQRYQKAYIENELVENQTGKYLCRMKNPDGNHTFYIAEEYIDVVLINQDNIEYPLYSFDTISTYVGKNMEDALFQLFFE
jgi:hypothetical protein